MSKPCRYSEPELTSPSNLCHINGRLNREAVGWSRKPLHTCNLSHNFLRKKSWNYWCITNDRFLFSATLSDIDYMGLAFVYFLDFETKFFHEQTIVRPLSRGCRLPDTVAGSVGFEDPKLTLAFIDQGNKTLIQVFSSDFGGQALTADILVENLPGHETLNVVIPWSDKRFQFTAKQNTLPTHGTVVLGEKEYDAGGGFACLDFGRGVWPYAGFWNWASSSGKCNGHTIGLNFGAGWTDGTGMNENAICIDGRLTKISEDLVFQYDNKAFMRPWRIKTALSPQVDVTFTPFFEREAKTNALVLHSEVHQMVGYFSGTVIDESGKTIAFNDLVGWAEEHKARW